MTAPSERRPRGGLHAYQVSRDRALCDAPFSALIFAAIRKADTDNLTRLTLAFPELVDEMRARYDAPGGRIDGDGAA